MDTNQRPDNRHQTDSPPTIEEIEAMLGQIQPEPGPRFFQRMHAAPWLKTQKTEHRRLLPHGYLRWGVYGLAACLTIIACFLIFPSLNAVSARIFQFFSPENSDRQNIKIIVPTPGLSPEYSLTVEQAQSFVSFPVHQPAYLPSGLELEGARYDDLVHSVGMR